MMEILFVILLAGGFLIPTALYKQWRLFWVFVTFFIIFGLEELLSVAQTGKSISQHFWVLNSSNPLAGWVIIAGMGIGWVALLWHFKFGRKK